MTKLMPNYRFMTPDITLVALLMQFVFNLIQDYDHNIYILYSLCLLPFAKVVVIVIKIKNFTSFHVRYL